MFSSIIEDAVSPEILLVLEPGFEWSAMLFNCSYRLNKNAHSEPKSQYASVLLSMNEDRKRGIRQQLTSQSGYINRRGTGWSGGHTNSSSPIR